MISKKYLDDYRVEYIRDEHGRKRRKTVYQGKYYTYRFPERITARFRTVVGAGSLLAWVIWFAGLATSASLLRKIYVVMPYVLIPIPMYYLNCGSLKIWMKKTQFIREEADDINSRFHGGALASMILAGISLAGTGLGLCVNGTGDGDWIFGFICCLLTGIFYFLFRTSSSGRVCIIEREETEAPEA